MKVTRGRAPPFFMGQNTGYPVFCGAKGGCRGRGAVRRGVFAANFGNIYQKDTYWRNKNCGKCRGCPGAPARPEKSYVYIEKIKKEKKYFFLFLFLYIG